MRRLWPCARLRRCLALPAERLHALRTLEPCAMCAGAMIHARLAGWCLRRRSEGWGGGSVLTVLNHAQLNHQMQVEQGILADESSELLRNFFRERRVSRSH